MAQRGRPKAEGELKDSSVRIRPALKAQLEAAAAESGESIAKELEGRLAATFTEVPRRGVTHDLLQEIAGAVREIEAETGKQWDKDLTTWAMLREVMANGPIAKRLPHPDEAAARNLVANNAELQELKAERKAVANVLRSFGIEPDATPVLGAQYLAEPPLARDEARQSINQMELPDAARATLMEQLDRLDELDTEIAALQKQVTEAMLPYMKARKAARDRLYRSHGIPDLPAWLTAPISLDEPPARRGGMFGR